MTKRKTIFLTVLILAAVALNLAAALIPFRLSHPDVSGSGVTEISEGTRTLLDGIGRDAEIIYYADSPDADLRTFLSRYGTAHVSVKVKKPAAPADDQTILIRSGERSRTFGLEELYCYISATTGEILSLTEYAQISAYLSQLDSGSDSYQMLMYYYGPDVLQAYFMGEPLVSAALRNLTSDTGYRTIYVPVLNTGDGADWYVSLRLEQYGFLPVRVSALSDVPAGATVWLSPTADLSGEQAEELKRFLSDGGQLFLTTSYQNTDLPNLASVLSEYGLSTSPAQNLVTDKVTTTSGSTLSAVFDGVRSEHAINEASGASFKAVYAHQINVSSVERVENAGLLRTSFSGGYTEKTEEGEDPVSESGTFYFAASAIRGESRVVWLGMQLSAMTDSYSGGGNSAYAAACFAWLGRQDADPLPGAIGQAREIPSALLNVKMSTFTTWIVIFVVLIPLALLAVALVLRYVRNKRTQPEALQ